MNIRGTVRDLKITLDRFKSANNKYYVEDMIDDINSRVEINTVKIGERNKPEQPQEELKPCLICSSTTIDYHEKTDFDFKGQNSRSITCGGCGFLLEVPKHTVSKQQLIDSWNGWWNVK